MNCLIDKKGNCLVVIEIEDVLTRYPSRYRWMHPHRWRRVYMDVFYYL